MENLANIDENIRKLFITKGEKLTVSYRFNKLTKQKRVCNWLIIASIFLNNRGTALTMKKQFFSMRRLSGSLPDTLNGGIATGRWINCSSP
jgi:hypothetical protein